MKDRSIAFALTSMILGSVGCAAGGSAGDPGASQQRELNARPADVVTCTAEAGKVTLALVTVTGASGKATLLSLTPAADVYALAGSTGTLDVSAGSWSWKGATSSLALDAARSGTWTHGADATKVTCATATTDAAAWRTAGALVAYAGQIDDLADTVVGEMNGDGRNANANAAAIAKPKPYVVFAVETARRASLALGTKAAKTAGALPGDDGESLLDENDYGYGGISAAYALGGGDDYGEWFQGASDGVSLSGSVVPALGAAGKAGFIAHEKATALASLVDSAAPSAVELTVGAWTFFLPDAFSR